MSSYKFTYIITQNPANIDNSKSMLNNFHDQMALENTKGLNDFFHLKLGMLNVEGDGSFQSNKLQCVLRNYNGSLVLK